MRQAAQRALHDTLDPALTETYFIGNTPSGVVKYGFPSDYVVNDAKLGAAVIAAILLEPSIAAVLLEPSIAAVLLEPSIAAVLLEPSIAAVLLEPSIAAVLLKPSIAAVLLELSITLRTSR